MAIHNTDISVLFNRMADLLEIEGANPFRVRAYRRAATTVEDLPESVTRYLAEGQKLNALPGIGDDLAEKIKEIVGTGSFRALEEVEARTPSSLATLTALPGLGPKRVHALHEKLGIGTITDLARAAEAGKVRELRGFTAATEAKLLKEIRHKSKGEQRFRIATAEEIAEGLIAYLQSVRGIENSIVAGSYRRRKETVGDLDILATCEDGLKAIDHFVAYDEVDKVLSKGTTRATVVLKTGIQVDLRVVPAASYGAALHYFTGSKAHNIAVRKLGLAKKLKINEYGVFRGKKRIAGQTEAEVYSSVGLPYIEPEIREERGEIDAAFQGKLPRLITVADLRGDLHVHTKASDGKNSLQEMAEAAKSRGYEYLAITDHSRHATVAHGLDPKRLGKELDDIDRLNDELVGVRLLKSCEVDILADGSMDMPESILKRLDFAVGAVHYRFDLGLKEQTERIVRAMDNRHFTILAHPTGRLLGERPGYAVDLDAVMAAAKERGCFLEVNSHPARLDLDDVHCRAAKELGLKLAISTDAHSTLGLAAIRYGVDQARRGWLEPDDVLNTHSWPELKALFKR